MSKCAHEEYVFTRDGRECYKCGVAWSICLREKRNVKLNKKTREKLSDLVRNWRKKHRDYGDAAILARRNGQIEAPRYEGISTGFRWCFEDLESLIKNL